MSIFDRLHLHIDQDPRSAALNMAVDEALLESAISPALRFYRWRTSSLSFGYFGAYTDVANQQTEREIVRRWTGGGIVLHGSDVTYSIVIPAGHRFLLHSPRAVYSELHAAIRDVLVANGNAARLANSAAPRISEACFANPVRADVMIDDRKIAGAAQRRTRLGLLHQGSIQHQGLPHDFADLLGLALCPEVERGSLTPETIRYAEGLVEQKYGTREWLRRR